MHEKVVFQQMTEACTMPTSSTGARQLAEARDYGVLLYISVIINVIT